MNQETRNKLRNVVTQCRKLLEDSVSQELEGKYAIFAKKDQVTADPNATMIHLNEEEQAARKDILDHFGHIEARGFKPKETLDQLVREIAFTHLNRLCAYKMMEAREVYVCGQKFREAVSRGVNSNGVKFYLADNPEDERLFNTGHQDIAYRHFLDWLGGALSDEIGVLFNPNDPANRLYPRQKTLDQVLDLLNGGGIKPEETELREAWPKIWSQDETIGWVYQYFTPKERRDQARKESAAPRNSYELAFRNQFFTPRYVVEFLTDNTLGRIWYEMRKGDTKLKDQCQYMVRRPTEIFLKEGDQPPKEDAGGLDDLSQEKLLKLPVHIPHRPKKDPRDLRIIDPACGSGHFLLYCFDLLLTIYEEAYNDPELRPALQNGKEYPTLEHLRRDIPRLILAHNIHGIDIDLRCTQIAALAVWLRCQRAYQEMGLKKDRPKITRSNFVCAEPMPGEEQMLQEFVRQLEPKLLGQVVEVVFEKMKLAGEAGSLLKIEEEIRDAVAAAKTQWVRETTQATDRKGQPLLFTQAAMDRMAGKPEQRSLFDLTDISDDQFFEQAEAKVIETLRQYAEKAQNGDRLQRRLFTEDAVRGFAFVDLCQKRYDVVLMNPPFGYSSIPARSYLEHLAQEKRPNLAAVFISRWMKRIEGGLLGALTTRNLYLLTSFTHWRSTLRSAEIGVKSFADLGQGVLDDAMVEAVAAVVGKHPEQMRSAFIDLLDCPDKQSALTDVFTCLHNNTAHSSLQLTDTTSFSSVPGFAYCYWVSEPVCRSFRELPTFDSEGYEGWIGLQTGDDFRWLRLWWEVPVPSHSRSRNCAETTRCWVPHAKGGDFKCYYSDLHLVVEWTNDGGSLKEWKEAEAERGNISRNNSKCWNQSKYFRPGITWTQRSQIGLGVRALPAGSIIGVKGPGAYGLSPENDLLLLGILNSKAFRGLVSLHTAFGSYYPGVLQKTPLPKLSPESIQLIRGHVTDIIALEQALDARAEVSHLFQSPVLSRSSLLDAASECRSAVSSTLHKIEEKQEVIDKLVSQAYGFTSSEEAGLLRRVAEDDLESPDDLSENEEASYACESRMIAEDTVSFLIGCCFGRWKLHSARFGTLPAMVVDPFSPLPIVPPAFNLSDANMPDADVSGILVDDADTRDDIVRMLRSAAEVIWGDKAEAMEEEACELLGVKELRDYFRRPAKGGFWDDHASRYSKSRRKAPIYWLLQSSKKNYGLWLYYHRLDKDLLFKALVNYVEPKIRLEKDRLDAFRAQKSKGVETGKQTKALAKDVERQEDFLSELRNFEDKLRRAANLHLEPELNDGVVLNIAPLHELVPWKEAKSYWEELLDGKYEWSSIGSQLRQKGLVT